jgi:anti-anti-sigma factor
MNGGDEVTVQRFSQFSLAQLPATVAFYNPPAVNKAMDRLMQEIGAESVKVLILDLGKIENCGSQLLTLLVHLHIRAKKVNKVCRVCAAKQFVANVIKSMGLNTIFPLYATKEEALKA